MCVRAGGRNKEHKYLLTYIYSIGMFSMKEFIVTLTNFRIYEHLFKKKRNLIMMIIKHDVCVIIFTFLLFLLFRLKGKMHQCQVMYQVWEAQVHQPIQIMGTVCV